MTNEESASSLNVFSQVTVFVKNLCYSVQFNIIQLMFLAKDVLPTMKDSSHLIPFFSLEKKKKLD